MISFDLLGISWEYTASDSTLQSRQILITPLAMGSRYLWDGAGTEEEKEAEDSLHPAL